MYKYKIMIIDDNIINRKNTFNNFLTNQLIDSNGNIAKHERDELRDELNIEFEVIYPEEKKFLDTFIEEHKVDAFFLDVLYPDWPGITLGYVLQSIRKHSYNTPIFVYSNEWENHSIIKKVNDAFRDIFRNNTPAYYYDLNEVTGINSQIELATQRNDLKAAVYERKFIKDIITNAYNRTTKEPFSKSGDLAILHISDIQYGDKSFTSYTENIWNEVAKKCKDLITSERIAGIDLLTITGDISMHGRYDEMDLAYEDLKKLFKRLWEAEYENEDYKERILLVPGNHDYDLNYCILNYIKAENQKDKRKVDFEKISKALAGTISKKFNDYQIMGFSAFRDIAYKITNDIFYYKTDNHLNVVQNRFLDWNLRFVLLNTADAINAMETNAIGINQDELSKMCADENEKRNPFTIVLSHHTPLLKDDLKGKAVVRKYEESFNKIIHTFNAKLWLGGHRHIDGGKTIQVGKIDNCKILENATITLEEKWKSKEISVVNTKQGEISSKRGFEVVILKKKEDEFETEVVKFAFDKDGVAHKVES